MGWLASIAVGVCSGVIGFVVALFASVWATEWYRIPQREGAAGFFAFAVAIVAFFVALVVGIVVARHVAAGESPSFLKALGITTAILAGTAVVGLGLARLLSDPSPKLDGRPPQQGKVPTREEEEAQRQADIRAKFRALSPEAPLADWLQFTHYVNPEDVQKAAALSIQSRPDFTREMAEAIRGSDPDLARLALWSFQFYPVPPISVAPDVDFYGQQLVASLRAFTELAVDDVNRNTLGAEISQGFSDWMVATRALQGQGSITFVPALQEIATLARKSADDHNIRVTVLRVASFYLHEWAGIEPLPGDPPPR